MTTPHEIQHQRSQLRLKYGQAFDRLAAILFAEDPIGLNFDDNADEYEPEVCTILPRLLDCADLEQVKDVVHQEFVQWFEADVAGPVERYEVVARRIWEEVLPAMRE